MRDLGLRLIEKIPTKDRFFRISRAFLHLAMKNVVKYHLG